MTDAQTIAAATCHSCRFAMMGTTGDPLQGMCRRYPPTPIYQVAFDGNGGSYGDNIRPWVSADDWCGEYQRDPSERQRAGQP